MKVHINCEGELCISAQSELELYALKQWYGTHEDNDLVYNKQCSFKDEGNTIAASVIIDTYTYCENKSGEII